MRLVTIKESFLDIFDFPTEIMSKDSNGNDRPFLMIISLKYKGKRQDFALPFRSNIQANSNTEGLYFPLPRRRTTREKHAHGLHYIKIFPVLREFCDKYIVPETKYDKMLMTYVEKRLPDIVKGAQDYLIKYEDGERPNYCTNIDRKIDAIQRYLKSKNEFDFDNLDYEALTPEELKEVEESLTDHSETIPHEELKKELGLDEEKAG